MVNVTEKTHIIIKKKFNDAAEIIIENAEPIGRPGIFVEVDETVISRRGIIAVPSAFDETASGRADLVWLVGGIERGNIDKERDNAFRR